MTIHEALAEAKRLCGPPPEQPVLRDIPNADTGDLGGPGGRPGQHYAPEQDPNNALLIDAWKTEMAAYNDRFNRVLDELLKTN